MNRKTAYMIVAALLIAALLPSGIAYAQGSGRDDQAAAREAIERTNEVIASAREIVQDTRSMKARRALEYSLKLQHRAENSEATGAYGLAYKLTTQARNEAWHAINLARTDARQEERLTRLAEHTAEKLVMLRSRIAETEVRDERTLRLMNESYGLLEKARINHQQLRGELALKLAENSFRLANQAEERFRRSLNLMEMCQRRLTILERLSERAYANFEGSGDERAATQLLKTEEQLARARNTFNAGRYDACRMNLEKAERLLRNMTRNTVRTRAGEPENMMAEARRLQTRAEEMIGAHEGAPENAYMLLEQSRRMLERAESAIAEGNSDEALRLMQQARRMMRTAVEEASSDVPPEQAAGEVDRAVQLGELVRNTLEQCKAEGARNLYERAYAHLERAKENLDKGQRERAVAEARIARNLFTRIREICAH
jgi:HEPN domain-containing protein